MFVFKGEHFLYNSVRDDFFCLASAPVSGVGEAVSGFADFGKIVSARRRNQRARRARYPGFGGQGIRQTTREKRIAEEDT
jgi:hypothetical protein